MITEFFAMLSQNLSSRKVSFIEVVGEFFTFLLDPGLVDIGLSSGRNCLLRDRSEACGNDFGQNPQLHLPAKNLVQVPWANQV